MDVSIILVSYNTKNLTRNCLESIYQFTKDIEFEVFVVDNNSQDGSPEMIEQEFPQVKLIKNTDNKGFGAANNVAIKESNAKYIFCLNTDTLLIDNSVKQFFEYMENHSDVGAVGGQLVGNENELLMSSGNFPNIIDLVFRTLKLNKIFTNFYENNIAMCLRKKKYNNISSVDYLSGADLFLRKSVIDITGPFDEDFFMYFEDTDLCKRIKKNGFDIKIIPSINIIHLESKSVSNLDKRLRLSKKSEILFFKKHANKLLYWIVKIYNTIKYGKL